MTVADDPAPVPTVAAPASPEASAAPDRKRLRYVPELDGIRGLGLLVVVVHHLGVTMWAGKPWWFLPGGQVGLDVFFALSGFLITVLLLGEHARTGGIRFGNFLWRRLLRLLPALAVFMVGLTVAAAITDRYTTSEMLESAAWVLTFTTNIGVHDVVIEVGHTWSMGVEAQFYLLWGVVVAVVVALVRRPYPLLAGLAVAGIVTSAVLRTLAFTDEGGATAFNIYVQSIYRMDAPLVGALAGVAWAAGWLDRVPPRAAAWASVAALAVLAAAVVWTDPLSPSLYRGMFTVIAAAGAVLVVGVQLSGPSMSRRFLALRPLVLVGTISYSVYLWHLPVMMYLNRNAQAWPLASRLCVALAATAVLGALSYAFVERPFLRRRARART